MTGPALIRARNATTPRTTDWFRVITDLMQQGISMVAIGKAMGDVQITQKMLVHYRQGTEPLHWRGDMLLDFWCQTLGRHRDTRPMREVVRGHRAIGVGIRTSHDAMQAKAAEVAPVIAQATQPEAPPIQMRRKPGPKPGSKRKAVEVV